MDAVTMTRMEGAAVRMTDHFDSGEFDQRSHLGEPWVPYPVMWHEDRLRPLCEELETLRTYLGGTPITIVSGYRTGRMNALVGGVMHSQHCVGRAADVTVAGIHIDTVWEAVAHLLACGSLSRIKGCGHYPGFVHLDIRPADRVVTWFGQRTVS